MSDDGITVRSGESGGIGWLEHRVAVAAPPDAVWQAYTTGEGLRGWAAPFVTADFRLDGPMESGYALDARPGDPDNILDRFIAFLPGRMLAFRTETMPANAPMDGALWLTMHQVVELVVRPGGGTEICQTVVGFRDGDGYRAIRDYMTVGNRWVLRLLRKYLEEGSVDWPAEMAAMASTGGTKEGGT